MARPEIPIDYTVPEVGHLAAYLRTLRNTASLTYAELAASSMCSQATLKRAARGGMREPSWETVRAVVRVCGGHEDEAWSLHCGAKEAAAGERRHARRSTIAPKPHFVRDEGDLSGALRDAYRWAGCPAVREMEREAGPGLLPRSTAHAIVKGRALPRDVRTYIAFLEVCEITRRTLLPWFAAWVKARGEAAGVYRQRVFSVSSPSPAEKLFIKWAQENVSKAMPSAGEVPISVAIVDGQQRISVIAELLRSVGGDADLAA
ncbi:helix-turn-helix transcriptional regulator [Streptomyces sp. NPDC048558]|uniref:helix-turn-helix domain-containing protein n=1 Tax=Streptomyces sp. NPDC048558 TaxID=3155759 RepID=UPI0034222868